MTTFPLFDSHAHLTLPPFAEEERPAVLERARNADVLAVMNVATDLPSLHAGWQLQGSATKVALYCAAATTPHDVKGADDPFFSVVEQAAFEHRIAAIGETGFDFFYAPESSQWQAAVFLNYATLAQRTGLPIIVHCRDAFPTLVGMLRNLGGTLRGVLHCFSGTNADARALLDLGWYLSISGIVTFPKSEALREVARFIPLDRLLVETDAPFLAPQQRRGQRNEPSHLPYTVAAIASAKGVPYEHVADSSYCNAQELFGKIDQRYVHCGF